MKIVLVRHGISQAQEIPFLICGQSDYPLSENGIKELYRLRDTYEYPETDYYLSSDLTRALQTFEILYPNKKLDFKSEVFREHFLGDLESTIQEKREPGFPKWLIDQNEHHEEKYSTFEYRIINGIKNLYKKYGDKSFTITTHAGVVKAVLIHLLKADTRDYYNFKIRNGLAYIFDIDIIDDELVLNNYECIDGKPIVLINEEIDLLVIRHGKTAMNEKGEICGSSDSPLSENGISELLLLKEKLDYPKYDRYYTSELNRTIQTLNLLFPDIKEYKSLKDLNEVSLNEFEGKQEDYPGVYDAFIAWHKGEKGVFEDKEIVKNRINRALNIIFDDLNIKHQNSATIIMHGIALSALFEILNKEERYTLKNKRFSNGTGCFFKLKLNKNYYQLIDMKRFD